MASATVVLLQPPQHPAPTLFPSSDSILSPPHDDAPTPDPTHQAEAITLAQEVRTALNTLHPLPPFQAFNPSTPLSPEEILAFPLSSPRTRIPNTLFNTLPSHKSSRGTLADEIAGLLYPCLTGSRAPLVRYNIERVRLRAWIAVQRKHDILETNGKLRFGVRGDEALSGEGSEISRLVLSQGPAEVREGEAKFDLAKMRRGVPAIPMPVKIATEESLAPFLGHLRAGGGWEVMDDCSGGEALNGGKGEGVGPGGGAKGLEFEKGVVYEDGRMDLCKMAVGPGHIGNLMSSLRSNTFVRHFLLGNNIIGPMGAREIAKFVDKVPGRMGTWYLAGNCIDGPSFRILVDALVGSKIVTNVWLKRNPLGEGAWEDVYRLITETENLRTLDLDQTELGDVGASKLFSKLAAYKREDGAKLPLRHLYINGLGISTSAADAVGRFLASEACAVNSIYMSHNPVTDAGASALAAHLSYAKTLQRLCLQSTGINTPGATAILHALTGHRSIKLLDLSQAYQTIDLGQAFNYITDDAVPDILDFSGSAPSLEALVLGHVPMTPASVREIIATVGKSPSILFYEITPVYPEPNIPAPRFIPSLDSFTEQLAWARVMSLEKAVQRATQASLDRNVRTKYGEGMSYAKFVLGEKRYVVSDREDIRKIDSVYRNRDARMARRGLVRLVKEWEEGDGTIEGVMGAAGPLCCSRRKR